MNKPTINGKNVSEEEKSFYDWCLEAKEAGILLDFIHNSESSNLKIKIYKKAEIICRDKNKVNKAFLLHDLNYTADFGLSFNKQYMYILYNPINAPHIILRERMKLLKSTENECWIDTKGTFAAKYNNSAVTFPILQKVIWNNNHLLINKVVPVEFYKTCFAPASFFLTKTGRISNSKKLEYPYKTVEQYVNELRLNQR